MKTIYLDIDDGPVRIVIKRVKGHAKNKKMLDTILHDVSGMYEVHENLIKDLTQRNAKITSARHNFIITARENGVTISELASYLNCNQSTILYASARKLKTNPQ